MLLLTGVFIVIRYTWGGGMGQFSINNKNMIKHCKCNIEKMEDGVCDYCAKPKEECICSEKEEGNCHSN